MIRRRRPRPAPAGPWYEALCQAARLRGRHVELHLSDRYDERFGCRLVARLVITDREHRHIASTAAALGSLEPAARRLLQDTARPWSRSAAQEDDRG